MNIKQFVREQIKESIATYDWNTALETILYDYDFEALVHEKLDSYLGEIERTLDDIINEVIDESLGDFSEENIYEEVWKRII